MGSIPMRLRQGGFRVSQTIKVVVINEHRLYRECFKHILEMEMDISVVGETSHADDIYEIVGTTHPDVVVYDEDLSRDDTVDLIQELSKRFNSLRCVLVTTENNLPPSHSLKKFGIYGCVLKSSKLKDLLLAIRHAAKAETYIDPRLEAYRDHIASIGDNVGQLNHLTPREKEVLYWLSQGFSNQNIAKVMYLSEKTVKNHVSRILKKLEFSDRTQAAVFAWKVGFAQSTPEQFYDDLEKEKTT